TKLLCAAAFLAALYAAADWREVLRMLVGLDPFWLAVAITLFLPQTLLSAARWRIWVAPLCRLSPAESCRQLLASSALNLVLPSKLGDLSKAGMLRLEDPADRPRAALAALAEKLLDVAALAAWLVLGALLPETVLTASG